MDPAQSRIALLSSALIALLLLVAPVMATLAFSGVSYAPNPPLVLSGQQHMIATYSVGPSGATTFVRGHELQMQTGLMDARWNIQVLINGQNAAQQSASGSSAFVNGALLSYSTNNDVSTR
jgi:hypothetical protein